MSYLNDPRVLFAVERMLLAWNRTAVALASSARHGGIRVTGPVAMQNLPTEARNGPIMSKRRH